MKNATLPADIQSRLAHLQKNPPPSLATLDTKNVDKTAAPVVLVDGSYYLFRCFYGLPPLSTKSGLPTNAVRGVLNALNKTRRAYNPVRMAVAFDTKAPTFRHQLSQAYKANRPPMDEALARQIPYAHRLIKALGIPAIAVEGFEADDIIGTLAYQACLRNLPVVISTGDKDMAQLVNDAVRLEDGFKGVQTDVQGVVDKFGVRPDQIVDYLSLMGDASDGIAGVPKVGAKTAKRLLAEYQNLDNILANADKIGGAVGKNLQACADGIALDRALACIVTDLDFDWAWDDLLLQDEDDAALLALYSELEFSKELAQKQKQTQAAQKTQAQSPTETDRPIDTETGDRVVATAEDLERLLVDLGAAERFAFCVYTQKANDKRALCALSFAAQNGRYYMPFAADGDLPLDGALSKERALAALWPLFCDPNVAKIASDQKRAAHVLASEGMDLLEAKNCHDVALGAYIHNAQATRHTAQEMARYYLDQSVAAIEDVVGRGAKQIDWDKADPDKARDFACQEAGVLLELFAHMDALLDENERRLWQNVEQPTCAILTRMERVGALVDRPFLAQLSSRFDADIERLQNDAYAIAGAPFNLASPKQLGEVLFGTLGLQGGKKTKTGQYSTSEEALSDLDHPLAAVALEHRALSRLKSAYTDALAAACDGRNRVHTTYHQALTATGRLSSSDPNLQNIPIRTDTGRRIRQAFIAPKGRAIVAADYSQIELRLMAHFSQDPRLVDAFCQGLDIHRATAAEIFAKDPSDLSDNERRSAKAVNFGLLYGMSSFGLARQLGVSRAEAKDYIDRYFARYGRIYEYMEKTKEAAQTQGYVRTILGRKLYMPAAASKNRAQKEAALRAAINAPLQGSAAEIVKLAMIAVDEALPKDRATLLLQVHDELVFEVDEDAVLSVKQIIQDAMQSVFERTAAALGFSARLSVPLVAQIGVGENWDTAH